MIKMTRLVAALAVLTVLLSLDGCVIGLARHAAKMLDDSEDKDKQTAQKKASVWTELSPQLQQRCRTAAAAAPALAQINTKPAVVFDDTDDPLHVPDKVTATLAIASARQLPLRLGRPADADYFVVRLRETVPSDPVATVYQYTLRVDGKDGKPVLQDIQFSLQWKAETEVHYERCKTLLASPGPLPPSPSPDFSSLTELFGARH